MSIYINRREAIKHLLSRLLELGKAERFEYLRSIGREHAIERIYGSINRDFTAIREFHDALQPADQASLIKAIAIYEGVNRGGGSCSMNRDILRYRPGGDNSTLDWVLRNAVGWYYSGGAISIEEYELSLAKAKTHREKMAELDNLRHLDALGRHAKKATESLCNAVRRGDAKAVTALFAKGADPSVRCQAGRSLMELAINVGNPEIIKLLELKGDVAT